ncbi:hypothetical protein V866_004768 [Kwoniella sp. B9012]|uniref:Uncharacterized protein n=1 Tax=Kwoniella europaea PYCC6329 TaxID=1423913 RepID=A0AAX4KK37_9TREE
MEKSETRVTNPVVADQISEYQDEEIHGNDVTSPSILINEITASASEQKQEITPIEQLHPEAENDKPDEVNSQEQFNSQGGARGWVKNPGKAAFFASTGLVIAVPTLIAVAVIAVPVLGALVFTSLGPAAGSVAAGAQVAGAPPAAGGLFSTLQSAAMGGYGVSAVNGAIQGTAARGAGAKLYHIKASKKKRRAIGLSCVDMRMDGS